MYNDYYSLTLLFTFVDIQNQKPQFIITILDTKAEF